jgi:hypothetical protein
MKRKLSKILGIAVTVALLASLLVSATPAAAMSQPSVTIGAGPAGNTAKVISKLNSYTLTFTANQAVAVGDEIKITFPTGTDVTPLTMGAAVPPAAPAYVGGDINIEATAGIGGAGTGAGGVGVAAAVVGATNNVLVITVPAGAPLGAGSIVQIVIGTPAAVAAGHLVQNTGTPSDAYTLEVTTQTAVPVTIETATSATFAITTPAINPLPGIVYAYNAAGVLMSQTNDIATATLNAGVNGRIEIGAGTYDENLLITFATAGQTIVALDAGAVFIKDTDNSGVGGVFSVTAVNTAANPLTIDGLIFQPAATLGQATMLNIAGTATNVKITNCTFDTGAAAAATQAINIVTGATPTIDGCEFTVGAGKIGIANNALTTISNNTFTVGVGSTAITNNDTGGVTAPATPATITGNAITGSSGVGVNCLATSGDVKLTNNTFSTLNQALIVAGGNVVASGNTIDACGFATGALAAIDVTGAGATSLDMNNNTVSGTVATGAYAIKNLGTLVARFNNFVGNTLNINGTGAVANTVDHNWWGASTGPAAGTMLVATDPFPLGAMTNDGAYASGVGTNALVTKTTAGVDVALIEDGAPYADPAGSVIGVSKLDASPVNTTPPIAGTGEVVGYYDVYFVDGGAVAGVGPADSVQIKFYGDVNAYTKIYYSGGLTGQWVPCNSGVNVAGGYAYLVITATSTPSIAELTGTPFAMVVDKTLAAPSIAAGVGGPTIGAYEISVNPTFTWGAVAGADHYEIAISEDPSFTIVDPYLVNDPFMKLDTALSYDTTYYWRVRGVLDAAGTAFTPWATGIFTTETEAMDDAGDGGITITTPEPEVTVTVPETPAPEITVEQSIPTYMLWIIVIVGAILVIALIVLIVRTRRVA